jgi:hypothetical protein
MISRRARLIPIVALVAANVVGGAFLASHYGQNIDEGFETKYGELSLRSYLEPFRAYQGPVLKAVGPLYLMIWGSAASVIDHAVPGWSNVDARHYVNFLFFQAAIVCVYLLSLRVARTSVAFAGALLFQTQPVLFGHGFINHKDSAFMAFFAVAVVMGLTGVDRFACQTASNRVGPTANHNPFDEIAVRLRELWLGSQPRSRLLLAACVAFAAGIPLVRAALDSPIRSWTADAVQGAYDGTAWGPVNWLFSMVAENSATSPVSAYVNKAIRVMDAAAYGVSLSLLGVGLWLIRSAWWVAFRRFAKEVLQFAWPAAAILGMAVAVRTAALFGGLLVTAYAWQQAKRRSAPFLLAYGVAFAIVAYSSWPQLWGGLFDFLRTSVESSLRFPDEREVLFQGAVFVSGGIPRIFLPWLIAAQLTVPALLLSLLGLSLTSWLVTRPAMPSAFLSILLSWFLLPFLAVIAFNLHIYNNFRHLLFTMPPLFVMGCLLLEHLLPLVRRPLLPQAATTLLLIPGVVGIVRLHPYEYVYYNDLVGGVRGAYGEYELDYWCTAYRETMEFVNETAPPGSGIAVWGPISTAAPFFREDLVLVKIPSRPAQGELEAYAAIGCSWATIDPAFFPEAPLLWTLERDGVPLAVVKLLQTGAAEP